MNWGPAWSPDGTRLAFVSGWYGAELKVASVDRTGVTTLASVGYNEDIGPPAWSPDGGRLIYASTRGSAPSALYVIGADGSNETKLVDSATGPDWSPDGQHIAYGSARSDVIRGGDRGDLILGGRGNDTIYGGGGDDVLIGGPGHDRLHADRGNDVLDARDGALDYLFGGLGVDTGFVDHIDRTRSMEYFPR
jgi:Ca2+-binding RTX toxin-like protein